MKKLIAFTVALFMGIALVTTTTGCPGKDTKKTDTTKTETESKKG